MPRPQFRPRVRPATLWLATGSAALALLAARSGRSSASCLPVPGTAPRRSSTARVKPQAPRSAVAAGAQVAPSAAAESDVGYNLLFETAAEEFQDRCVTATRPFPAFAKGDFVIPSIGQLEMGGRQFVGFLDCFGKLQRFEIDGERVCATYRMMESGFFNESKKAQTVAPGLLFFETEPPRETPWFNPIANMPPFAPNDNTYVNTMRVGGELLSLTDSYTMLKVDPRSMQVTAVNEWEDNLQDLVCYTGSAHPLRSPRTGAWIDFVGNGNIFSDAATLRLFELRDEEPRKRRGFADVEMETAPYVHSFGVTQNYVVIPRMPVKFSAQSVAVKPMASAFQQLDIMEEGPENAFHVVPLDGSPRIVKTLPIATPLWYVHTANAYENASGIVIDLTTTAQNPFASDLTLEAARSKEVRDRGAAGGKNLVKRFLLPLSDDGPVTSEVISDPQASTDFPTINPRYQSKEHRFYWAVEWFAGSDSYASMAIVKHDVRGREKRSWARRNWYPSEAIMVPSDREGAAEDEGVLLFVALDGASGATYLLGVDAQTMETVSEAGPFPRIGFTTHGQFYPAGE